MPLIQLKGVNFIIILIYTTVQNISIILKIIYVVNLVIYNDKNLTMSWQI